MCPYCGGNLRGTDSGEPDCILGWYCDECIMFFDDEELAQFDAESDDIYEDQFSLPGSDE